MLERLIAAGFDVQFLSHAAAIFAGDFPEALSELEETLVSVTVPVRELVAGGGGETPGTQRLRNALKGRGWEKHVFKIQRVVDGSERESQSHEVDHVRRLPAGTIGLEIEWNNKDPFFDRDLENFKRLHADGAISAGVIITRGAGMQQALRERILQFALSLDLNDGNALANLGVERTPRQQRLVADRVARGESFAAAWVAVFCSDKFGEATTQWRKLQDRVRRGVGNPCPLLLIGLPPSILLNDEDQVFGGSLFGGNAIE